MTRNQAIAKFNTEWWKSATSQEIVRFQLYEKRLCCPFEVFHKAIEEVLNRPVWTHEFGLCYDQLKEEYESIDK